jgi:prepilin-type N-terminal cleavage/methylation domain-containing protein
MNHGFTFVEVLVALLVAAILVAAASSTLIASLSAEQTAARLQDAGLLAQTIASRTHRRAEETNQVAQADWAVSSDVIEVKDESATNTWRVWLFFPKDRPSLAVSLALREDAPLSGGAATSFPQ